MGFDAGDTPASDELIPAIRFLEAFIAKTRIALFALKTPLMQIRVNHHIMLQAPCVQIA
jgi:hypothetical protein